TTIGTPASPVEKPKHTTNVRWFPELLEPGLTIRSKVQRPRSETDHSTRVKIRGPRAVDACRVSSASLPHSLVRLRPRSRTLCYLRPSAIRRFILPPLRASTGTERRTGFVARRGVV